MRRAAAAATITDITKVEKVFNKVEKLVDKIVDGDGGVRIVVNSVIYTPAEDNCFVMTIKGLWGNKNSEVTKEFKIHLTNAELEIFNTKQIIAVLVTKMVEIIDQSK